MSRSNLPERLIAGSKSRWWLVAMKKIALPRFLSLSSFGNMLVVRKTCALSAFLGDSTALTSSRVWTSASISSNSMTTPNKSMRSSKTSLTRS